MNHSITTYIPSEARRASSTKIGSRSSWMSICLTLPVVAKIILPSSFEELLEIQILGVPVFLPTLLIFFFFLGSKRNRGDKLLKIILLLQLVFMLIGFIYNQYSQKPVALLLAGNYYYYAIILGLTCRLTLQERYWVEKIYSSTLIILGFEVILLGLGIVKGFGGTVVADEAQSFDDFFRVSTTAGGATGTAVHLYLLTTICIMLSESRRWRYILFAFGLSTTLLTVSRGASLAFMMYFLLWLYFRIKEKKGHKLKLVFGAVSALAFLYALGVFNPIMERMTMKSQDATMFESREDRAGTALLYYQMADSKLLGVGIANLYRSTEIHHIGIDNNAAPHNSYIQTLCEQGIIGVTLFIFYWIVFLIVNRKNKPILMTMIPLLLVIWNTESSVVSLTEFVINIAVLLMLALDKGRQEKLNIM